MRFCVHWRKTATAALAAAVIIATAAAADECLNPDALGTSRVLAVDPAAFTRVGGMQYRTNLPLGPKEIVLTFDDGPMPPMTVSVLQALRQECVRATFFLIGRNARAYPALVRRIAEDGHTLANHGENHVLAHLHGARGFQEFDRGFASIAAALAGSETEVAPFFRFPGLLNTSSVEGHARSRSVSVLSADVVADDWRGINADRIVALTIARLQEKGRGIVLLHDVQPALALALPKLLLELKKRGYRVVHIVPAPGTGVPASAEPQVADRRNEKPPVPARQAAARKRATPAKATPADGEFKAVAYWRKLLEQRKAGVTRVAYPAGDGNGP